MVIFVFFFLLLPWLFPFLCLAYNLYSRPGTIYHIAISKVPSPFLAGKPLEHLCIVAARLHSGPHLWHLSSFVQTFYLPVPRVKSYLQCPLYNERRGGEVQENNLIKPSKQGQRGRRGGEAQKAFVRLPEEEHSQMAVRKQKQWCGTMPIPPSHLVVFIVLLAVLLFVQISPLLQINTVQYSNLILFWQSTNYTSRNQGCKKRKAPVRQESISMIRPEVLNNGSEERIYPFF